MTETKQQCPAKKGDLIWVTCEGRKLEGHVVLASSNHRSLMVAFPGILAGFVGMAPLLWTDGVGYEALNGVPFELELR